MNSRIDVLCCALSDVNDALLARYENLLSIDELERLRNFRSASGAKEFIVGRALLRTALATRIGVEPSVLQFEKNDDGKPFIAHPTSNWRFNLSHSHDRVALALCENGSIGIDVESYARRNNLHGIAQRFFSATENTRLAQCADSEWLDVFFAVWTLKEAHAKALGCGLSKILACSSIAVDLAARNIEWALSDIAHPQQQLTSWLYKLDAHNALAVVAHGDGFAQPALFRCVPLQAQEPLSATISAHGVF